MRDIILVLQDIRSIHNVGALFRTADAIGVTSIICAGITATPDHPRMQKTALGAEKAVPWSYTNDITATLRELKLSGHQLVIAELTQDSVPYNESKTIQSTQPMALVLGSETDGVAQGCIDIADEVVHLPMNGTKESLNVAVAGSVLLYAFTYNNVANT